jgi:hypothetical protein
LGLQQELPVYSFQIKIVHPKHGASLPGRHYELRRYANMWTRSIFVTPFLWGLSDCRYHCDALGNVWKLLEVYTLHWPECTLKSP